MDTLKCPKCKSTKIAQYRTMTGAIWCMDCQFREPEKEKRNSFIVPIKQNVDPISLTNCNPNDSCDECDTISSCLNTRRSPEIIDKMIEDTRRG